MKTIAIKDFLQREQLERLINTSYPYFSLCANVDITAFSDFINEHNKPFSISFLYAAARIANEIPEFCRRISKDGQNINLYDNVNAVMAINNSLFTAKYSPDFFRFVEYSLAEIELAKSKNLPPITQLSADDVIMFSEIPLVSFTGIAFPFDSKNISSVPHISWGKPFMDGKRIKLPLSVQVHNGLVNAEQVSIYFDKAAEIMAHPECYLRLIKDDKDDDNNYDTRIIRASSLNQRVRSQYPYEF